MVRPIIRRYTLSDCLQYNHISPKLYLLNHVEEQLSNEHAAHPNHVQLDRLDEDVIYA